MVLSEARTSAVMKRCDLIKAPVLRLGLAALSEEDPQGRPRIREQKAFQVDVYACLSSQQ